MKSFLKNIPLHCFLFGWAFIFFLYVYNFPGVQFSSIVRSLLISLFLSSLIFIFTYLFYKKNQHKAGFLTGLLMLPVFTYGLLYEMSERIFFSGWWPFANIHRYLFLSLAVLYISLFIYMKRNKRTYQSVTLPLNIFILLLFSFNLANLGIKSLNSRRSSATAETLSPRPAISPDSLPDIYYIILDGYANDRTLARHYNFSNNSLTSFLSANGFYTAKNSKANYMVTLESLSSSLNYTYLDSVRGAPQVLQEMIYKNQASRYLRKKGYKIIHIHSGYSITRSNFYADENIIMKNLGEFERTLLRYTLFRLDDLMGYAQYNTLKEQFSVIYDVAKISGPKYVFLHIVAPHPPYVCDEKGNFKSSPRILNSWWEPKSDFVKQTRFVNRSMQNFISELLAAPGKKPIIILQSDHGPWMRSKNFGDIYESRTRILNSYFVPDSCYKHLYDSISPVNSFPFVFNHLFGDSIPLKKDIALAPEAFKTYSQTGDLMEH